MQEVMENEGRQVARPNPRRLVCSSIRSWDFTVLKQRGLSEAPTKEALKHTDA